MEASLQDKIGVLFTDALIEIVSKVAGYALDMISSDPDSSFDDIVSFIHIGGAVSGTVFLSGSESVMRLLCAHMVGLPQNEITREDIDDALSELANMTAGNVKLRMGAAMQTLSMPCVMSGRDMKITTKKRVALLCRSLGNTEIRIKLKVMFCD